MTQIPAPPPEPQPFPHDMNKLEKIEDDIRLTKIRDMNRIRDELSKKLEIVNQHVTLLERGAVPAKSRQKSISKERSESPHESFEVSERKRQEAAAFILKMKQQKEEWRRKDTERQRIHSEKRQKAMEEKLNELSAKEEETRTKRRGEVAQVYKNIKQKREEDKKKNEEWKHRIPTTPKGEDYLYKKLEDKYNREVLLPILEEKKQELAKKRNQFKPLSHEELEEHKKMCERKTFEHEEVRTKGMREKRIQEEETVARQKKMRTDISMKYSLIDLKNREEQERKKGEKKLLKVKMRNYANLVKEVFAAKTSEKKVNQMHNMIEQLRHPVRQTRDTRRQYDLAVINDRKQKEGRSHSITHNDSIRDVNATDLALQVNDPLSRKGRSEERRKVHKAEYVLKRTIENQQSTATIIKRKLRVDYLAERRKKREDVNITVAPINWKSDLKNRSISSAERCDRVVNKANAMELKAKMQEKVLHAKGGTEKNPELGECVTDMFIEAIKAKLAVLEQF